MKIKASEATKAQLNWMVAMCEGDDYIAESGVNGIGMEYEATDYTTNWSQGGPIIEREGITVSKTAHGFWEAYKRPLSTHEGYQVDETPLIAAMRCYVESKLGEEVEVPDSLS